MTAEQHKKALRIHSLLRTLDRCQAELEKAHAKFENELSISNQKVGSFFTENDALRFEVLYPPHVIEGFRGSVQLVREGIERKREALHTEFAAI